MSNADELARTATAHASSPAAPIEPTGPTVGRYRLERELGAGGMGVVHVAFDPDLERRVALKVLRAQTGGDAAKRLQREARAMARLNHPNVVTVHEVGTASGRDYVAMELIEGQSLAEWLRGNEHAPRQVIEAFLAAGRGLAAAHAAGIVHRDFKPHNVLRSRDGRVCVTDFGLAREASAEVDPLAETRAPGSSASQSTLSGLTVSGSVLGTPAYMAPEQWDGSEVTGAADQFGFCVALWEALTGQRPYRGPSVDELKKQVAAGPQTLDASKIPRRVRSILRRGLDPDPSQRWRSMDELLVRLARAERRPWMVFAGAGAALIAAGVLVFALGGKARADACPAPVIDADASWSEGTVAAVLAAGQGTAAKLLAADHAQWKALRAHACTLEPAPRAAALACFDGVLARFDAVARAATQPGAAPLDVGNVLVDPVVCSRPVVPRLSATASAQLQEVLSTRLRQEASLEPDANQTNATALADRITGDPCAEALAQGYLADVAKQAPTREHAQDLAEQAAERCGDDRIRADLAVAAVGRTLRTEFVGPAFASRLARAEVAVQRVAQPDLEAQLALFRLSLESRSGRIESALAQGEAAAAGFAKRGRIAAQIDAEVSAIYVRQVRAAPADLVAIASTMKRVRALAMAELGPAHPVMRALAINESAWLWASGDIAGAHRRFEEVNKRRPIAGAIPVSGTVVDERGEPMAGATVVAGKDLSGDRESVVMPFATTPGALRWATTKADGSFVIPDAAPDGVVVAQRGTLRAAPVSIEPTVRLVLEPTSRLSGRVELHDLPALKALIVVSRHDQPKSIRYGLIAPVAADGSFEVAGAPRGEVDVQVMVQEVTGSNLTSQRHTVTGEALEGLTLAVPTSRRTVSVLVRSTVGVAPGNAQVIFVPGAIASHLTAQELTDKFGSLGGLSSRLARPFDDEAKRSGVEGKPGDLVVTAMGVPDGLASACAVGLPTDVADESFAKALKQQLERIEIRCVPIAPDAKVVVVEVPPWPRFD